jgi:signal peptidase
MTDQTPTRSRARAIASGIGRIASWTSMIALLLGALAMATVLRPTVLGGDATWAVVTGSSMEPTIHAGSLSIALRQDAYAVGDIVVYAIPAGHPLAGRSIIHRIIGGDAVAGYAIQGDNAKNPDPWAVAPSSVEGRVLVFVPFAGAAIESLRTPAGIGIALALLLAIFGAPSLWRTVQRRRTAAAPAAAAPAAAPVAETSATTATEASTALASDIAAARRRHRRFIAAATATAVVLAALGVTGTSLLRQSSAEPPQDLPAIAATVEAASSARTAAVSAAEQGFYAVTGAQPAGLSAVWRTVGTASSQWSDFLGTLHFSDGDIDTRRATAETAAHAVDAAIGALAADPLSVKAGAALGTAAASSAAAEGALRTALSMAPAKAAAAPARTALALPIGTSATIYPTDAAGAATSFVPLGAVGVLRAVWAQILPVKGMPDPPLVPDSLSPGLSLMLDYRGTSAEPLPYCLDRGWTLRAGSGAVIPVAEQRIPAGFYFNAATRDMGCGSVIGTRDLTGWITYRPDAGSRLSVILSSPDGSPIASYAVRGDAVTRTAPKPSGLSAVVSTGVVSLSWTASAAPVSGYRVFRDGQMIGVTTATAFTDAIVLSPGQSAAYAIDAFTADGAVSAKVSFTAAK